MNSIYRAVWSRRRKAWMAVAESASVRRGGAVAAGVVALLATGEVQAQGMHGVAGLQQSRLTEAVSSATAQWLQAPSAAPDGRSRMAAVLAGEPVPALVAEPADAPAAPHVATPVDAPARAVADASTDAVSAPAGVPAPLVQAAPPPVASARAAAAEGGTVASVPATSSLLPMAAPVSRASPAASVAAAAPLPPPVTPAPPSGLVIGTGGLLGGAGTGLAPLTLSVFGQDQAWLRTGALSVNRENINARFSVVNVLGLPVLDLAPVAGTLQGTLGGGLPEQRLTLLGGVTSASYLTNLNNGLTYNNGLLLPNTPAPSWVQGNNCANVLGLVGATCWDVPAAQNNQVLIGDGATANGSQEVVIGTGARHLLPAEDARDVFTDPDRPGVPTTDYSMRKGYSVVIGDSAFGNANAQTVLGANASATAAGAVALGHGSVADRAGGGVEAYSGVAIAAQGAVSVGAAGSERQITNVAGGTADTDAVNLRQLRALEGQIGTVDARALRYDDDSRKVATLAGTGGTRLRNVAAGEVAEGSTDAVNGGQLHAVGQNVTQISNRVTDIDIVGTRYFRANSVEAAAAATGAESVAAGGGAAATGAQSVALGGAAQATHDNSVALGAGSTTSAGAQADYVAYALAATQRSAGEVSVGRAGAERRISNVAAGSADTDAANVAQLKALGAQVGAVDQLAVKYDDAARTSITLNAGGGATRIVNVAAGTEAADSTDAVNGGQLWRWTQDTTNIYSNTSLYERIQNLGGTAANRYVAVNSTRDAAQAAGAEAVAVGPQASAAGAASLAVGSEASSAGERAVALGAQASAAGTDASAIGAGASAQGQSASAVGAGALASADQSTALGAGANATAANSVALGQGSVADRANTVSVGTVGGERQIANVADGTADTDAANMRQLRAMSGDVTNVIEGRDGMFQVNDSESRGKPVASGSDASAGGAGAVASGTRATALGNAAQATGEGASAVGQGAVASGSATTALGSGAQAAGASAVALGAGAAAAGSGSMALGAGAQAASGGGLALGQGAQVASAASGSVALGAGSVADRAGSVSVGAAGGERYVTNVRAGVAGTDAVNVQQLQDATRGVNDELGRMRNDLRSYERNAYAGAASAMAAAGLPQAYVPGRSMASAAASHYLGQSAIALGVSTVSENGRWVYKFSGNVNTQGNVGAVVGAGYQW